MSNSGLSLTQKKDHMKQLAEYRDKELRKHPKLKSLFLELTALCNEHCRHCGSRCGDIELKNQMSADEFKAVLREVREEFKDELPRICVTGGEPLLSEDFFDIAACIKELGFSWGMTSNGTLITKDVARRLHETGMSTISISVDGLRENHEWFRQSKGSYDRTIEGIKNLIAEGGFMHIQITTVVHHKNIDELDDMYEEFRKLGIRSWRVINIEPIGRAREQKELLLSNDEYKRMFNFILEHRLDKRLPVTYGCSHYLGAELEREVRQWYFLCNAGVYTASVMYNGDVGACLDIERRAETIQGNVREKRFTDIWRDSFEIFRSDYRKKGKCADCKDYRFCAGDAFHTWNFDEKQPFICMKEILK